MESLVAYYRKYESDDPRLHAQSVTLGEPSSPAKNSAGARPSRRRSRVADARCSARRRRRNDAAADVHARRAKARCSTPRGLRYAADGSTSRGSTPASPSSAAYAPYVENGSRRRGQATFKAGDLVRVTLTLSPHEGAPRYVAVTDPLPPASSRWNRGSRRRPPTSRARRTISGAPDEDWSGPGGSAAASIMSSGTTIASQLFATRLSEGRSRVLVHRPGHDGRDVPDGAGARRGDVRAGGVWPDGDRRPSRCGHERWHRA